MTWAEVEATWDQLGAVGRQQYAGEKGYCCWAGMIAWPEPCPWHPVVVVVDPTAPDLRPA